MQECQRDVDKVLLNLPNINGGHERIFHLPVAGLWTIGPIVVIGPLYVRKSFWKENLDS